MPIQLRYQAWLALRKEAETCTTERGLQIASEMKAIETAVEGFVSSGPSDMRAKLEMALGAADFGLVASVLTDLQAIRVAA